MQIIYIGEESGMSGRIKKRTICLMIVLLAIVFFVVMFVSRSNIEDEYKDYAYAPNYVKELNNVTVLEQKTSYTCNAVTMAIVRTYLGLETNEDAVRSELGIADRKKGMLPNEYLRYSNKAFEPLSYSVSLLNPKSEETILKIIVDSLSDDLPVVVFYSRENDWNKPSYDTHYAVIYGIDIKSETVMLSNPYGYLEELTFSELYDGLSFKSYKSEPIVHWLGQKVGMPKKNNLFKLEKLAE